MPHDRSKPHTVWFWLDDGHPELGPDSRRFDNADEAEKFAQDLVTHHGHNPALRWVKVFRSDNESYVTWFWETQLPVQVVVSAKGLETVRYRTSWTDDHKWLLRGIGLALTLYMIILTIYVVLK
jgi:hypothetical protein